MGVQTYVMSRDIVKKVKKIFISIKLYGAPYGTLCKRASCEATQKTVNKRWLLRNRLFVTVFWVNVLLSKFNGLQIKI